MTTEQALIKTLDFQLDIQSDNESLLYDATLESRSGRSSDGRRGTDARGRARCGATVSRSHTHRIRHGNSLPASPRLVRESRGGTKLSEAQRGLQDPRSCETSDTTQSGS